MNDFTYTAPPTKMIFGESKQNEFISEIKQAGGKVLLVMGGSSFQKNGYYNELIKAFDEQKIKYVDFKGVTAPLLSKVREGAALCRTEKIGCVIGIGGGTCMDMAKAIAFAALQEEDVLDFLTWKLSSEGRPCLPIGEIVTYPSSGSEMDGSAQIDDDETHAHMGLSGIYPTFAWLNPRYVASVPKEILVYGTMTSVAQISTGYLSMESSDMAESVSAAMIKSLLGNLESCVEQTNQQEARKNLMLASALNSTGIFGFGKGYDWTLIPLEGLMQTYYGIGYSKAITIMFPYWLKHIYRDHPVFTSYFEKVFGLSRKGKTAEEFLKEGLDAIFGIYRKLGIAVCYNKLVQKPLDLNRLRELIREYGEMPSQYMEFTPEKIEEILLEAIEGLPDFR